MIDDAIMNLVLGAIGGFAICAGLWFVAWGIYHIRILRRFIDACYYGPLDGPVRVTEVAKRDVRNDMRRSLMPSPVTYALAGETIVCEGDEQHPIVDIAFDVPLGALQNPDDLTNWRQTEITRGAPAEMCICDACGHRFYDGMGGYHFKDGWR